MEGHQDRIFTTVCSPDNGLAPAATGFARLRCGTLNPLGVGGICSSWAPNDAWGEHEKVTGERLGIVREGGECSGERPKVFGGCPE